MDLLAAAKWIDENKSEALKYLAKRIQQRLSPAETTKLSRIVTVREDGPALTAIHGTIQFEHGVLEMKDTTSYFLSESNLNEHGFHEQNIKKM